MTELTQNWIEIQGEVVDGRYALQELIAATDREAMFRTVVKEKTYALRVSVSDGDDGVRKLARWKWLRECSEPGILRVFEAARSDVRGVPVVYALTELWDDDVSTVLRERGLTEAEMRDVLESVTPALVQIHDAQFVHGGIEPARIVAVGDLIKLNCMGIREPGARRREGPANPHDAPESGVTGYTQQGDMWSLGVTIAECLTQRVPEAGSEAGAARALPAPFAAIAGKCFERLPEDRPDAADVLLSLRGEAPGPVLVNNNTAPPPEVRVRKYPLRMIAAALTLITVIVAWWVYARTPAARPVEAPPPVKMEAKTAAPLAAAPAVRPIVPADPQAVWRVVSYTFNQAKDAQKKANSINEKWPTLHAAVFAPEPGRSPYLVALGGRMTRDEAMRLRRKAVAAGLPRDTYAQNFRH
jgi:hypothetical protein